MDNEIKSANDLTPAQKAAILSMILKDDSSSKVLVHLSKQEIESISKEIVFMKSIGPDIIRDVIDEFYKLIKAKEYISVGGLDYAKELLNKTLGPDEARKIIDKLVKIMQSSYGFEFLNNIDPKQLVKIIQNEHPQTIAIILSHLDQSTAAEVLAQLPKELQSDITLRIASLDKVSPAVIKHVSEVLEGKMENISSTNIELGGVRKVSEVINRMSRAESKTLIESIAENNPELAGQIRDMMFVFEDIIKLNDTDIQELLKHIDKKDLVMSLKGSTEEISEKFFSNMSSRAGDTLKEEIEFLGAVKVKNVEMAQKMIVDVVRKLDEEGVISIGGGEEEEVIE